MITDEIIFLKEETFIDSFALYYISFSVLLFYQHTLTIMQYIAFFFLELD